VRPASAGAVVDPCDEGRCRVGGVCRVIPPAFAEKIPRRKIVLPDRHEGGSSREPDYPYAHVPEKY